MYLAIKVFRTLTTVPLSRITNTNSQIAKQIHKQKDYRSLLTFYNENYKMIENDNCIVNLMRQIVNLGYRYPQGYQTIAGLVEICAKQAHAVYSYNDLLLFASVVAHHNDQREEIWSVLLKELERVVPSLPAKNVHNFIKILALWKDKPNFKEEFSKLQSTFLDRIAKGGFIKEVELNEKIHIFSMMINKPEYIDFADKLKDMILKELTDHPVFVRFYVNLLYPKHGVGDDGYIEPELWTKIEDSINKHPKDWNYINFVS